MRDIPHWFRFVLNPRHSAHPMKNKVVVKGEGIISMLYNIEHRGIDPSDSYHYTVWRGLSNFTLRPPLPKNMTPSLYVCV
jgi:hypothetical protein